jgi:iron(III) transport system ATP-binding protein
VVQGGAAPTPLGAVPASDCADGAAVQVLIRPEALRLAPVDDRAAAANADGLGRVEAARMLGRSSLVHLSVFVDGGPEAHMHCRVPGHFLPAKDQLVAIRLDATMAFVFPAEDDDPGDAGDSETA